MAIPRGGDTLIVNGWIPSAEKIKYPRIFGAKLKWRKRKVFSISLSTDREAE